MLPLPIDQGLSMGSYLPHNLSVWLCQNEQIFEGGPGDGSRDGPGRKTSDKWFS